MADEQIEKINATVPPAGPAGNNEAVSGDSNGHEGQHDTAAAMASGLNTLACEIRALKVRLMHLEQQCSGAPIVADESPMKENAETDTKLAAPLKPIFDRITINPYVNDFNGFNHLNARTTRGGYSSSGWSAERRPHRLPVMNWGEFKEALRTALPESMVIAILEGMPGIYYSKDGSKQAYDGSTELPERIGILSQGLVEIVSGLSSPRILSPTLVLLRPYRILTIHDSKIRRTHEFLARQLAKQQAAMPKNAGPTTASAVPAAGVAVSASDTSAAAAVFADLGDDVGALEDSPAAADTSTSSTPQGHNKYELYLANLSCLVDFMDTYLAKRIAWLQSVHCEKIYFSDIWHVFKCGDFVISTTSKQAYQIVDINSGQHSGKETREESAQNAVIFCVYIAYDGTLLGPVVEEFVIERFNGERGITTLDVQPLRHHVMQLPEVARQLDKLDGEEAQSRVLADEIKAFKERLVRRGRKFISFTDVNHMEYAGPTADKRDEIESHVIVDVQAAFAVEANKKHRPILRRVSSIVVDRTSNAATCRSPCCSGMNIYNDANVLRPAHKFLGITKLRELEIVLQPSVSLVPRNAGEARADGTLSRGDYMIMSYAVFGFVLKTRSWANLDLDFLNDMAKPNESAGLLGNAAKDARPSSGASGASGEDTEDDSDSDGGTDSSAKSAFSQLVLPQGHKEMVLSLVSEHFRNKESAEHRNGNADIVKGKGKGLILLLHGAPGVGKTTTAEGVAEMFGKPLFQITCADLGTTAKELEESLQTTFALASRWGCILLLDEADVFLAARDKENFTRNGLVAVFLRTLEYYTGLLFLTTNRLGDLDEAFVSRIHMTLHFPQLDRSSTVKICRLNLKLINDRYKETHRSIKIDKDEIRDYVSTYWDMNEKARWNGRQIRNACQTAMALAEYEAQSKSKKRNGATKTDVKVHLKVRHVERVADTYLAFFNYLKGVYGSDLATRAKDNRWRTDDVQGQKSR